jgi:hypothetical protein
MHVNLYMVSLNFSAKDARGIRKGARRRLSSATFAQNFATFAFQFTGSSPLPCVLDPVLN